jgi:hypothetical protein
MNPKHIERHEAFHEAIETAVETVLAGETDAETVGQVIYSGIRLVTGTALTLSFENGGPEGIHPHDAVKLGVIGVIDGALDLPPDEERMVKTSVKDALRTAMKHSLKDIQRQRQQLMTRVAAGSA